MTPDDKNSLVHIGLFWVFMILVATEWIFGWPTNDQLSYIAVVWLIGMCCSSLYACHLESKKD
jgi:hypothetical protein